MGTNYYAIPKVEEPQKKAIYEAIKKDDYETAKRLIPKPIHIGKSSIGWAFLFNHNDWKYFHDMEGLECFLKSSTIVDEYGSQISYHDFFELIHSKANEKKNLLWNGYEIGIIEFGLNFSTSTDFS